MVRSICFDLTISTKDYPMAGQVAVIEDGHLLSRLDRYLLKLEKFCALISGLAILSLMFLAVYSVTG